MWMYRWTTACLWLLLIIHGSSGCQPFSQQQQQNPTSYCPSCNDGPTYNAPSQLNAPNQYYAQIPQQSPIPPFAVAPPVNGPLPQQDALPSGLNSNDLNVAEVKGEENKLVFAVDTTTSPLPPANPFVGVVEQEVDVRCSTPQEFGSVNSLLNCLQVEHTPFAGQAGNVQSNHMLNCTFDGAKQEDCSFYSSPQEQIFFGRATFPSPVLPAIVPSLIELFHRTPPLNNISNQLPAGYFLIAHEPVGNDPRKSAILRLDIACQMGDGLLSFDYWSSYENVLLKVCTRLDRERRCTSQIVYGIESPRVEVQVVHPQPSYRSAFAVEIIVSGFFQPAVFLIDNLVYEANLCSGPLQVAPAAPERIDQARGISKIKWSGEKTATLLAKKAAKALSIYNLQAGSEVGRPRVYHQASLARLYPLVPRSTTYWHLKQQANNFKQLQPLAQYEQSSVTRNNFTPNKLGIRRLNACELLGCSFDHENWCHYTQPSLVDNGLARYGKWQLARPDVRPEISRRILQASKGFAFVGGLDNHLELEGQLIYILQSASFKLDHPVKLLFDLYQRSNSISLQVCLNHLDNCVYESPAIIRPNTFWRRNQMVEVPVSTHRIPDEYKLCSEEVFLKFDGWNSEERVLIFSTNRCLDLLVDINKWGCDGTFDVVPLLFDQLWILFVRLAHSYVPVVFCLLNRRLQSSYEFVLKRLLELRPKLSPKSVAVDFEKAEFNAFQSVFPKIVIRACFFHLQKSIVRNVAEKGNKSLYDSNSEFRHQVNMIPALAFVSVDDVGEVFESLRTASEESIFASEMESLLDYFEDSYVGRLLSGGKRRNARYMPKTWSVRLLIQTDEPTTSNGIESFNGQMIRTMAASHPTIWKLIKGLQTEFALAEQRVAAYFGGENTPRRGIAYRHLDERIKNVVKRYEEFP